MTIAKRILVFFVCLASFFVGIAYLAVRPTAWPEELCYLPVGVAFAWAFVMSRKMKREKLMRAELMQQASPTKELYGGGT